MLDALHKIHAENQKHFRSEVPLFTKQLVPRLAVAEEPDRKFAEQESFGTNRCQIIADALLVTWYSGDYSPKNRLEAILQNFDRLGLELQQPYLNANSEDIYAW